MKKLFLIALIAASLVVAGQSMVFAKMNPTPSSSVQAPYWQAGSTEYTFVAITNGSIVGNVSRFVQVYAVNRDNTLKGNVVSMTIDPGKTARIFIMATGGNSAVFAAAISENLIDMTSNGGNGHLVIDTPYGAYAQWLSAWGAIFFPSSLSGFSMEFIGDASDSISMIAGTTGTLTGTALQTGQEAGAL